MRITVVHHEKYTVNSIPDEVVLSKDSEHVPSVGDMIKVGHTLSDFKTFRVSERVFRSKPSRIENPEAFQEVILVVENM